MRRARFTLFEIPFISISMGWLCRVLLKVTGCHFEGKVPDVPKCVVVFAPHNSNWDFIIGIIFGFALGIKASFLGKDSIFRWPILGWLFFRIGGIPVDRSKSHRLVDDVVGIFSGTGPSYAWYFSRRYSKELNHGRQGLPGSLGSAGPHRIVILGL